MKRQIRGAAFAAAPFLIASAAHAQGPNYTAPRNAVVDAAGARTVEVEAAAGSLRVEGRPGLRQVQVIGTARSSSQQFLNRIRLIAERRGDVVFIKADIPDRGNGSFFHDNNWAALDLVIQVPQGINADVSDGSGEAKILNVGSLEAADGSGDFTVDGATGTVRVTDGSGSLKIQNVGGDVKVSDGSGEIDVRNVTGSFTVESDGSGSIHASDIRGSVIVESDGSGEIEVSKVGRDFRVDSKGSGSIDYATVSGLVVIPERHRGRERDWDER